MEQELKKGASMNVPSVAFNFVMVINNSSYNLSIAAMHNDIMAPILVIEDVGEKSEGDKAIENRLGNLEGIEGGSR